MISSATFDRQLEEALEEGSKEAASNKKEQGYFNAYLM